MFAIFEDGGKQYRVSAGDKLSLEKKDIKEGETIEFREVLLVSEGENTEIGAPFLAYTVSAKVVAHGRGDKIRIGKMKAKKRFRKVAGHRQQFTEVEITGIAKSTHTKEAKKEEKIEKEEKKEEVKTEKKAPAKKAKEE